jgi:CelD/BcsL family acetyltransferase involved in cellulose biosynthesis
VNSPPPCRLTTIDAFSTSEIERLGPGWDDLTRRALEPNPFAEKAFLIPALRRLPHRKLVVLCVWNGPDRARLDAIAALRTFAVPFGVVDVWRSEQAPLAALLLDREGAAPALEAMSGWLARRWPGAVGLGIANVDVKGALADTLRTLAAKRRLRLDLSNPRRRAALACGGGANFERLIDAKRRKEWARLKRRLMELGRLEFEWAAEPAAIEDFLTLEAAGWKGARGTTLNGDPKRAAFAREMLAGFASQGRMQIARLSLDGRPIATGAMLRAQSRAYYWKTAYDPDYATFSPGLQLTLAMSSDLQADRRLTLADSCADPDHPMIDRIWTERIDLADFVLETTPHASAAFEIAICARRAKALARERVKGLVNRWRRRSPSPRASAPPPAA